MSESQEQKALIQFCDYQNIPIFAIPNGGKRNPKEAAELKRQGVKAGVPDLFVPVPAGEYHGCFIEMKYGKNKPTKQQKEWMAKLSKNNYACYICYSCEEAVNYIRKYLSRRGNVWNN